MPDLLLFSVFTVTEEGEMWWGLVFGLFFFLFFLSFFLSSQDFSLFMVLLHCSALNQECCRAQHCALIKRWLAQLSDTEP